jgi:murein DD-endopeptidase MepM/ murein hydrolase activator NlpD
MASMNELRPVILENSTLEDAFAHKAKAFGRSDFYKDAIERKHAAQEFASFLYLEVLKAMRVTLPKDSMFETDSLSRDIYTSMFDVEVARILAKRDGEGFTRSVERTIEKMVSTRRIEGFADAPVEGVVSSSFGIRQDPIDGRGSFHRGVDIAAAAGTQIKAVSDGRVIFSGKVNGYGNLVDIDHGAGLVTRYAHNAANLVVAGEEIKAGRVIAIVGNTGRANGPHVHLEVRQNDKPVDPEFLIGPKVKGGKMSVTI